MPILYEDRAVLAIDKPRSWMLVPFTWQRTNRNLQTAILSSIQAGDYWARSRSLKFLRYVHRLDAETTGILLFAKSQGAVEAYGDLFESRQMHKTYLAVSSGVPEENEWVCRLKLAPDEKKFARMKVDELNGKESETHFKVLQVINRSDVSEDKAQKTADRDQKSGIKLAIRVPLVAKLPSLVNETRTLIQANPVTGRTHQIRVHLAESGCPVFSDELYGRRLLRTEMGLRAVRLTFADPFTRKPIDIRAPIDKFCREYGFDVPKI